MNLLGAGSRSWFGPGVSSGGVSNSCSASVVSDEGRRAVLDGCCRLVILSSGERDVVDLSPYSSSFITVKVSLFGVT